MKFRIYKGEDLQNVEVSYKIDGVRAHKTEKGIVSRQGKPLYNIKMNFLVAEVFCGSWEETVSKVRTHAKIEIPASCIYNLIPIDSRLLIGKFETLSPEKVNEFFTKAISSGYEGLVLRTDKYWYKVKSVETEDITVTNIIEGTGKYAGMLGAFVTSKGKIGTGFTDEQRKQFYSSSYIGTTIEVKSMGNTPAGKFRHPRFIRERFDK